MTPTRLRLAFSTSFVLLFCSVSYLYHTYRSPIYHPLADKGDAGLFFPNDPVPRFNFKSLAKYPAQNLNEPSKFTFATFYCSRNPSMLGPYFESTQSIIWRILWSDFRTSKYPIVVFVCPFIPEENRQILRGQGAVVKEIELLDDIVPDKEISTKRWIDVLSKLNLWKEVEWKRIMFLDSDAFPVRNIDDIFDMVPEQKCDRDSLGPEDAWIVEGGQRGDDMCNYVYAGVSQFYDENINAGMLLLKPNLDMHAKLIRAARSTGDYKPSDLEQGVLRSKNAFAANGPFPVKRLPVSRLHTIVMILGSPEPDLNPNSPIRANVKKTDHLEWFTRRDRCTHRFRAQGGSVQDSSHKDVEQVLGRRDQSDVSE